MRRSVLALAALAVFGCKQTHAEGDITYAEAPTSKGSRRLTLDIRVPEGAGPFPTVVFIHGGGWILGDLKTYEDAIQTAAKRGFVGVTINYRLADEDGGDGHALSPWPAQIQDVRCALRWVAANAATYKIDTSRVATAGDSAGGHLAMMAGYAQNDPRFEPAYCPYKENVEVKAIASIYGASDLAAVYETTEWWVKPYITRWLNLPDGAKVTDYPQQFEDANPVTYLRSGSKVPAHIIQGTADTMVRPETQRAFIEAAQAAGQDVTIEYQEGVGHDASVVTDASNLALNWLSTRL
jgi:acetyl esterase/lipase